jgi:hypothetical protein
VIRQVVDQAGNLVIVDHEVVVHDHGTGLEPVVLRALGTREERFLDDEDHRRRLVIELRSGSIATGAVEVWVDADIFECHRDELPERLLSWLTGYRLKERSPAVRLHAGGAVSSRGGALLVVGASGSGKSTLIAHFAARGFAVMSDEIISVHDRAERVSSFERPLMIRKDVLERVGSPVGIQCGSGHRIVAPESIGSSYCPWARPEYILFPNRVNGLPARLQPLRPEETFERLCANTFDLAIAPDANITRLADLAASVPAALLTYVDAQDALETILQHWPTPPTESLSNRRVRPSVWRSDVKSSRLVPMPEIVPGVRTVDFGTSMVVVDAELRRTVRLNEAGSRIWRTMVAGGRPRWRDHLFVKELEGNLVVRRAEWCDPRRRLRDAWRMLFDRKWIGPPIGRAPINEHAEEPVADPTMDPAVEDIL